MSNLFNNASWGGISAAVRLVFGMANLFLAVRLAGTINYGYLALMLSVATIYLTFVNSIHTIAVTHAVGAKNNKNNPREALLKLFSAVWLFTIFACVFIFSLVLLFGDQFVQRFVYWGDDSYLASQIDISLLLVLMSLIFQLTSAANVAILESLGRFDLAARSQMFGPVLGFSLFAGAFLRSGTLSIWNVALIVASAAFLDTVLTTIARWRMGYLAAYFPQKGIVKLMPLLLKEGFSLQGARLVNVFVDPLNKYLLNLFVGAASIAVYEVAMKITTGIQGLFGGAFRTFLQLTNEMRINSGQEYLKSIRYGLLPAMLLHTIAGSLSVFLCKYWFSEDAALLPSLLYLMIPASVIIIFIAPLYFALIGIRDLKFIFKMNVNLAALNIIGSLLFIPAFGLFGCVIGFAIAITYNAILEYQRYVVKIGEIPGLGKEIKRVIPKLIFVTIIGVCLLMTQKLSVSNVTLFILQALMFSLLVLMLLNEPLTRRMFGKIIGFGR